VREISVILDIKTDKRTETEKTPAHS